MNDKRYKQIELATVFALATGFVLYQTVPQTVPVTVMTTGGVCENGKVSYYQLYTDHGVAKMSDVSMFRIYENQRATCIQSHDHITLHAYLHDCKPLRP